METNNNLNTIIKELAIDERIKILEKLKEYVKDEKEEDDENIIKKSFSVYNNTNISYAKSLYDNYSIIRKILFFLKSIVTGTKKEDIVINYEVKKIKKSLKSSYNQLVDFDRNYLTSNFIKELINLIKLCLEIKNELNIFFSDQFYYYGFLSSIVEEKFTDKILENLNDIISFEQNLDNNFIDIEEYSKEKEKKIKKFFVQLDMMIFENINNQFSKFQLLLKLINFDFDLLLKNFYILDINDFIKPSNYANFFDVDSQIHKLFRILSSIIFRYEDINFIEKLINYSSEYPPATENKEIIKFNENTIEKIKNLFELIDLVKLRVPFISIFKYFYKDLLFKPKLISIKYNFLEIYKEYKKLIFEKMLNNYYIKIKNSNLFFLLNKIIPDFQFNSLFFFNIELKNNIDKYSSIKLNNIYHLNFLYSFINNIYKTKIENIVNRILIDAIFKKDIIRANLSSSYYTLLKIPEKINNFDNKFNENDDNGKKIYTVLKKISQDINFRSTLFNIVVEANEESESIKNEIIDSFNIINNFFNDLLDVNNPTRIPITNFDKLKFSGYPNSFIAIEKNIGYFNYFFQIIKIIDELYKN